MSEPIWIRVSSGKYIDLAAFTPSDVKLSDIVTALSLLKRCNGHYGRLEPLSVLQHSMLTADLAALDNAHPALRYAALVNDAHEAYIGDTTTPIKMLTGFEEPVHIKCAVRHALGATFSPAVWQAVKRYDYAALEIERKAQWEPGPGDEKFWPPSVLGLTGDQALDMHYKYLHMGADHFIDKWHHLWMSA